MLRCAITGGMGCGKSYVSSYLRKKGYLVLDADEINRICLSKGHACYNRIVDAFSDAILNEDGSINKIALSNLVFTDENNRKLLESITHPMIMQEILDQMNDSQDEVTFAEVPLLFEGNYQSLFDKSITIYADQSTALKRLYLGRNIDRGEAIRRIERQMDLNEKVALADYWLDNSEDKDIITQIDELLEKLKEDAHGIKRE